MIKMRKDQGLVVQFREFDGDMSGPFVKMG
jgi:hypothetical protein